MHAPQVLHTLSPVPFFMVWNSVLALVPLGLALVLFRSGRRTTGPGWWAGVVVFLVMLPNAPYVLTDVVHLVDGARDGVLIRTLAIYAAFFTLGMLAYTVAVARFVAHLRRVGASVATLVAVEVGLHGLVAIGVLIGRYGRWNSWDLGTRPLSVIADSAGWASPRALVAAALLAFGIGAITITLRLAARGVAGLVRARTV